MDPKAESYAGLSPYNSMGNSPMNFTDPLGDEPLSFLIGAAIGVAGNGVGNLFSGQSFFRGAGKAALVGAMGGDISAGIGNAASNLAVNGVSQFGVAAFQVGAHALAGGGLSAIQGGNFWRGAAAGAFSSGVGSGIGALGGGGGWQILGGTLSGGVGSAIAGGSFWQGAVQGAITSSLNHAAHHLSGPGDPPWDLNGDGRLSLSEANKWYREGHGKSIVVDASKIDLDFLSLADWEPGQARGVQTLTSSSDGLIYGQLRIHYEGRGSFYIAPDNYGFEMQPNNGTFSRAFRNFATKIGDGVAGRGTPYAIFFTNRYIRN